LRRVSSEWVRERLWPMGTLALGACRSELWFCESVILTEKEQKPSLSFPYSTAEAIESATVLVSTGASRRNLIVRLPFLRFERRMRVFSTGAYLLVALWALMWQDWRHLQQLFLSSIGSIQTCGIEMLVDCTRETK
jgi:hypothetical protein